MSQHSLAGEGRCESILPAPFTGRKFTYTAICNGIAVYIPLSRNKKDGLRPLQKWHSPLNSLLCKWYSTFIYTVYSDLLKPSRGLHINFVIILDSEIHLAIVRNRSQIVFFWGGRRLTSVEIYDIILTI